jgi:hypothetical protein
MRKIAYVAGKYTGKTWSEIEDNIKKAEALSIKLIQKGWAVITPHKNTAHYEIYEEVAGLTYKDWIEITLTLLAKSDAMFVLKDWRGSTGTKGEIDFLADKTIPIFYEELLKELPGPEVLDEDIPIVAAQLLGEIEDTTDRDDTGTNIC